MQFPHQGMRNMRLGCVSEASAMRSRWLGRTSIAHASVSFAIDLHRNSKSFRLARNAPARADLSTVMVYAHVYDKQVEDAMRRLLPT